MAPRELMYTGKNKRHKHFHVFLQIHVIMGVPRALKSDHYLVNQYSLWTHTVCCSILLPFTTNL